MDPEMLQQREEYIQTYFQRLAQWQLFQCLELFSAPLVLSGEGNLYGVKVQELSDTVTGTGDILLDCDESPVYLPVLPSLSVRNITDRGNIVVFQNEGQTLRIPCVRLNPVHLGFCHQMRRYHHTVNTILGQLVGEVEPFESRLVDEADRTLGKFVSQILNQYRILCFHRYLMDQYLLTPNCNPPCLLRILKPHKNLFTFDYKILYSTSIHWATSLSLVCGAHHHCLFQKEGSLSSVSCARPLLYIATHGSMTWVATNPCSKSRLAKGSRLEGAAKFFRLSSLYSKILSIQSFLSILS